LGFASEDPPLPEILKNLGYANCNSAKTISATKTSSAVKPRLR
jgi:hypothetical protein